MHSLAQVYSESKRLIKRIEVMEESLLWPAHSVAQWRANRDLTDELFELKINMMQAFYQTFEPDFECKVETGYYIWHMAGDGKVRASHAANEGRIFS